MLDSILTTTPVLRPSGSRLPETIEQVRLVKHYSLSSCWEIIGITEEDSHDSEVVTVNSLLISTQALTVSLRERRRLTQDLSAILKVTEDFVSDWILPKRLPLSAATGRVLGLHCPTVWIPDVTILVFIRRFLNSSFSFVSWRVLATRVAIDHSSGIILVPYLRSITLTSTGKPSDT